MMFLARSLLAAFAEAGRDAFNSCPSAAFEGGYVRLFFGKYEGLDLDDPRVPTQYIRSLLKNREEYTAEIARREQAAGGQTVLIERIIAEGFAAVYAAARSGPADERAADMVQVEAAVAALHIMVRKYSNYCGPAATIRKRQRATAEELLDDEHCSDEDREWAEEILSAED